MLTAWSVGRGGRNLTWRQRVNIAVGAAKGRSTSRFYFKDGKILNHLCFNYQE